MRDQALRLAYEALLPRGLSRTSAQHQKSHLSSHALRSFFTSTQPQAASSRLAPSAAARWGLAFRSHRLPLARRLRSLRWKSDKSAPTQRPNPTPHLGSPEPAPSLSQRLKKLSREYGWTAVGVYFTLSALDFPFCFLAVRMLGTDRIGHYEEVVIDAFWKLVRIPFPNLGRHPQSDPAVPDEVAGATEREGALGWSGEVDQAAAKNRGANASTTLSMCDATSDRRLTQAAAIWTQLALAYAIHKSFIFIRVPLTAAILPKVVKTLRGWGYNIGKRKPKST
ncbi:hypothetical protein BS50DRAFT_327724 [Corynespora cassiicola Philippines]|uniref:DUF1279 domain-containing protein n=1 Tax=Corynespora cassiicola Philippines TaxID=1448308 RepID=A0A2T2NTY5_CORCC|nr:hypothetical protein BS50DRAFT_327724 [Corynespora cassiicola Philippines]